MPKEFSIVEKYLSSVEYELASKISVLLRVRPKWGRIILYMYWNSPVYPYHLKRELGIGYKSLKNALEYLSSPPPLIAKHKIGRKRSLLVLTANGVRAAETMIAMAQEFLITYGRVNVERVYGVSEAELQRYIAKRVLGLHEEKPVYFVDVVKAITKAPPEIAAMLSKPELVGVHTVEVPLGRKRVTIEFLVPIRV